MTKFGVVTRGKKERISKESATPHPKTRGPHNFGTSYMRAHGNKFCKVIKLDEGIIFTWFTMLPPALAENFCHTNDDER